MLKAFTFFKYLLLQLQFTEIIISITTKYKPMECWKSDALSHRDHLNVWLLQFNIKYFAPYNFIISENIMYIAVTLMFNCMY